MKTLASLMVLGMVAWLGGCAAGEESVESSEGAGTDNRVQAAPTTEPPALGEYVLDDKDREGTLTIERATESGIVFSLFVIDRVSTNFGSIESVTGEGSKDSWLWLTPAAIEDHCQVFINTEGPGALKVQQNGPCGFGKGVRAGGVYRLKKPSRR